MEKASPKQLFTILLALVVSVFCTFVMFAQSTVAKAMELNYDEYDLVFTQTVQDYSEDNFSGKIELIANKELLYDLNLDTIGYIYDFCLNDETGYATVVNTNGYPEVAEIYFGAINPLKDIYSKRIFITNSVYAYSNDSTYFWATGNEIAEIDFETLNSIAYYSANSFISTSSETIYYTARIETDVLQMAKRHPSINVITGYENACVPISGANIIQYWDRFNTNLIENYTPGIAAGSYYLYNTPNNTLNNVVIQLYNLMGTNTLKDGTTISQFKSGMTTYCSSKGYNISYESCMNNGRFNYAQAKEKMNNGRPLAIFTYPFTFAMINSNGNSDVINYTKVSIAHSVTGFGYKDIKYTLINGQTRIDNYIEVASGLAECGNGYFNINYDTIIDDAYGIYIC